MKKVILAIFLLGSLVCNAEHLARVQSFSGVLVFSKCTPINNYESLGTVSFSMEKTTNGYISMNGMIIPVSDSPQYNEIRNGLVIQAVLANRETEGIIIKGKSATMIKFADSLSHEEKILARPDVRMGISLFVDSEPIDGYKFIKRKKVTMVLSDDHVDGIIDALIKKFPKRDNIDGIIVRYVTGGSDNADGISFDK